MMPPIINPVTILGLVAQLLFSSRIITQWVSSERAKKVLSPNSFWSISLLASMLFIVYAILRNDIVILGGQLLCYYIYIRNLQLKQRWHTIPHVLKLAILAFPAMVALAFCFVPNYHFSNLVNNGISAQLLAWGTVGQIIFALRFVYQWLDSEKAKESKLGIGFWIISLTGSVIIFTYALLRNDWPILIGNLCGLIAYSRNLYIILHYRRKDSYLCYNETNNTSSTNEHMDYNFNAIEAKWQAYWAQNKTFATHNQSNKPKYYVLDMFPYPSGAGLHVGHPLGYIASDIVARYKRHKGFNVLHPMGYDSFGLPAEQYAIQTGQHPKVTTEQNIKRYREQLDKLGFSFDWDREIRTSDPNYYKWTQHIFLQLFNAWYNNQSNKAEPIANLIAAFEEAGNKHINAACSDDTPQFTAMDWKHFSAKEQSDILMKYRLAYLGEAYVNWCPTLGTVLANDEVKDGLSERGGHPVERKLMKQWSMRITAYAQRLLDGLADIDWSESIKEAQRNWIGKSEGCSITFNIQNSANTIEVFTTRPDTIFGISFLTIAPEHQLVNTLTTAQQTNDVEAYVQKAQNRSERERQADAYNISGVFTGSYAVHPFTNNLIPIWVGDYVLATYGTGAVMAVPAHDERDHKFAKHFNLPINQVITPTTNYDFEQAAWTEKTGTIINSDFLNGLNVKQAIARAIQEITHRNLGQAKTQFRIRDAAFGRQRYWGEPIPIYYKNNIPYPLNETELPLVLPEITKYLPTETGEPPLARAAHSWQYDYEHEYHYEHTTMPGWAGSSWYFLRYMDPNNTQQLVSQEQANYWGQVDLYVGGTEHATGHLVYVRFWTKFLKDIGTIAIEEPAKKLINQGMIQGRSNFVYRINGTNTFVSAGLRHNHSVTALNVDIHIVHNDVLDIEAFKNWRPDFNDADFVLEHGKYICGVEVEKMSKSKFNVQSPDEIADEFGADTLRLYEMFLGPFEQSKPWSTSGITGVHSFLKKLWRLFFTPQGLAVSNNPATEQELKILHKTIKKVTADIEQFSFNTSVSTFMICVNDLTELKCNKRAILEPLLICLAPYAPHITEELWQQLGHNQSIAQAAFPEVNEAYLTETNFNYPVSFNGKMRFLIELPLTLNKQEIEQLILTDERSQKWLTGTQKPKIVIVPGKIINVVV